MHGHEQQFTTGTLVEICGLVRASYLNKRRGSVVAPLGFNDRGRLSIKLSDTGEEINVKPQNLIALNDTPPPQRRHHRTSYSDNIYRPPPPQHTNNNGGGDRTSLQQQRESSFRRSFFESPNDNSSPAPPPRAPHHNSADDPTWLQMNSSGTSTNNTQNPASPTPSSSEYWDCPRCTFVNKTDLPRCSACDSPQPTPAQPVVLPIAPISPQPSARTIFHDDRPKLAPPSPQQQQQQQQQSNPAQIPVVEVHMCEPEIDLNNEPEIVYDDRPTNRHGGHQPPSRHEPEIVFNGSGHQSTTQDYLQRQQRLQQKEEEIKPEPRLLSVNWDDAVSALADIVGDEWSRDQLAIVLQHHDGNLEDSIATIVDHPNPDALMKILAPSPPQQEDPRQPDITTYNVDPGPSNGLRDATETRYFYHGGYNTRVSSVVFSADGQYILTGASDDVARCFDLKSGTVMRRFEGTNTGINCLAISEDGKNVVTGSGSTATLWDFVSKQNLWNLNQHTDVVESVDISSDGSILVSGSRDGSALVCVKDDRSTTSQQLTNSSIQSRTIKLASGAVSAVTLSSDNCRLVTGSSEGEIKVFDLTNGLAIRTFRGHSDRITSVSISSDGRRVASGSNDKTAQVWSVSTSTLEQTFKGHTECVNSVSLSSDGSYLATASADKLVKVWNCDTGEEVTTIEAHTQSVNSVAFYSTGRYMATASDDGYSKLFDLLSHCVGVTRFFQIVEEATNDEANWPTERLLDELSERIGNVQELKLYYTACTAALKKGELDRTTRNQYVHKVLKHAEKALYFDKDRHVFTALKQVLKKAKIDKVIDEVEYDRLLQIYVSADVFADYRFQSLVESVRQNNIKLGVLNQRISSVEDYAKAIDKNFRRAQKRRAIVGTLSAVIGLASFGFGTGLVSAAGDIFGCFDNVVDFADSSHILSALEDLDFDLDDGKEILEKFMDNWEDRPLEDAFKSRFDQSNMGVLPVLGVLQIANGLGDVAAAQISTSEKDEPPKDTSNRSLKDDEFCDSDIDTAVEDLFPLHSAIKYGDFELLQNELVELSQGVKEFDINLQDERDRSAADYAAIKGEVEMMDMITNQGGKFNLGSRARMRHLARERQKQKKS